MRLTPTSTLDFLKQILADPVSTVSGTISIFIVDQQLSESHTSPPAGHYQEKYFMITATISDQSRESADSLNTKLM